MATKKHNISFATKSAKSPAAHRSRVSAEGAADVQLSELMSFRVHLLARLTDQHAESSYLREVGLKLLECRIVGVVGRHAPIGFKALCERAELEKSNASRMVASLIERGWLARHGDPVDQRSFLLSLTKAGRDLRDTIHRLAVARNGQWLSVLDGAQREVFATCLARLTSQARRMLDGEIGDAAPGGVPDGVSVETDRVTGTATADPPRMAWIDQRLAEQLYSLLGAALDKKSAPSIAG